MAVFESTLVLLAIAVVLLQLSRRLGAPYPSMLALAGACVAALPFAPSIQIDPRLALALFIPPALLDSAYDIAPRELRRIWPPLAGLVLIAVVLTTAAVAWAAVALRGLPLAAAITLGAVVAPPDAAAAAAVLSQFRLPRRILTILQGESLLNDAVALLIFGAAVSAAAPMRAPVAGSALLLAVAVPGGILAGIVLARIYLRVTPWVAGTLSASIVQFVATFGAWLLAERLRISPIMTVVVFAMTIARDSPALQRPGDRIHSHAIWEAVVFVLNVLAFLLMGLQARGIVARVDRDELWRQLGFAGIVLAIVILVRLVWSQLYAALIRWMRRAFPGLSPSFRSPAKSAVIVISWCGMRGLITLATAFALPEGFPGRDVIVLSAFAVVLGTLVLQGLTLKPVIRWLKLEPDTSLEEELSVARAAMVDAALAALRDETGPAADIVREEYAAQRRVALDLASPQGETEHDRLRLKAIAAERQALAGCRRDGRIDEDVFHRLEEELDFSEVDAGAPGDFELLNT